MKSHSSLTERLFPVITLILLSSVPSLQAQSTVIRESDIPYALAEEALKRPAACAAGPVVFRGRKDIRRGHADASPCRPVMPCKFERRKPVSRLQWRDLS